MKLLLGNAAPLEVHKYVDADGTEVTRRVQRADLGAQVTTVEFGDGAITADDVALVADHPQHGAKMRLLPPLSSGLLR